MESAVNNLFSLVSVPGWQLLETTNVIQERPHFLLILLFHFSGPTQRNRMPFILPEINTEITKPWAYGLASVGSDVEQSTESDQNILK